MKIIALLLVLAVLGFLLISGTTKRGAKNALTPGSFYDLQVESIDGDTLRMSDYKGKYVLCVNVASRCGFTPQYKTLQKLYEQHQDKLVIIGFPSNQFLGQEPGTEEEIATFCERNFGVTFPLSAKIKVKGKEQHPVYTWLTKQARNGVSDAKVSWNFNKFMISPEGKWLKHFPSKVGPLSEDIVGLLQ